VLLREFSYRLGWIVPHDINSKEAFFNDPTLLTHISPTWYTISKEGDLEGSVDLEIIDFAIRSGVSIVPLISNHDKSIGFSRTLFYEFCNNKDAVKNFINQVLLYKDRYGFHGINLDFENLSAADSMLLVELLETLRENLPDIEISIDVPPRLGGMLAYTADAYDYTKIANFVDYVIVMVYDYHWSTSDPGPVTPMFWLKNTVKDMINLVPLEKLVIGLPLYGYDWSEQGPGRGISSIEAMKTRDKYKVNEKIDDESFESFFEYTDEQGRLHYIFYQNKDAVINRLTILKDIGIKGVAFWYWGAAPIDWFQG